MMETIQEILNFSVGKLTVGNIISALVIFLVCHAVIKALMGPIERLLDKLNVDLTLRGFLRTVIRVVLNFVAVCIVAESIGIPIASLLAVLGMLGLAVSLSVQGALSNLSNGIMLLITKPFKAGDYIAAAGIEGTVKEISRQKRSRKNYYHEDAVGLNEADFRGGQNLGKTLAGE